MYPSIASIQTRFAITSFMKFLRFYRVIQSAVVPSI